MIITNLKVQSSCISLLNEAIFWYLNYIICERRINFRTCSKNIHLKTLNCYVTAIVNNFLHCFVAVQTGRFLPVRHCCENDSNLFEVKDMSFSPLSCKISLFHFVGPDMSRTTVLFHPGALTLIKGILYINNKDPKGYSTYSLQEYRNVSCGTRLQMSG